MKAIQFTRYGGPEVLEYAELPDLVPAAGEMLIRVRAIGVNPADGKWRAGMFEQFAPIALPHVGGYDIAGEVIGGEGLPIGTRVAAMLNTACSGAYAGLAVADATRVVALPGEIDFATGAALPTPGLTGLQAVDEALEVKAGHRVLITGAAGAVGRYAVLAAKEAGATVVAAVREIARAEALALGADEVVVLDGAPYNGASFDRILDTVGGSIVAPLCRAAKPGGRIATVATTPIPADGVPVEITFFGVHPDLARFVRLVGWVAQGRIAVPIAYTLPLAEAATAQRRVEAGSVGGKIVLVP